MSRLLSIVNLEWLAVLSNSSSLGIGLACQFRNLQNFSYRRFADFLACLTDSLIQTHHDYAHWQLVLVRCV